MICVDLAGVGVAQPGKPLFSDLSLTVSSGDRVAIVGVNVFLSGAIGAAPNL